MPQNNQQPYFPHEANTRNKDRQIRLRMAHGVAGYGVYFMLLERLRSEDDFSAELDYDVLSFDFDCDVELIRSVINDFGLFEVTDNGRRFHSMELTEKMTFMLEAKQRRTEAAKKAAECRWGRREMTVATNTEVETKAVVAKQPELPLDYGDPLKNEIEALRNDEEWCASIMENFSLSNEGLVSYLDTFRLACIGNGSYAKGHASIDDAKAHCRNYINKLLNAPKEEQPARRRQNSVLAKETENIRKSDMEIERRRKEEKSKKCACQSGDNLFRNKGYEPTDCSHQQLYDPEWLENNPPTHPEWIGRFPGRETVEMVLEALRKEAAVS